MEEDIFARDTCCGACSQEVHEHGPMLQCERCPAVFHYECAGYYDEEGTEQLDYPRGACLCPRWRAAAAPLLSSSQAVLRQPAPRALLRAFNELRPSCSRRGPRLQQIGKVSLDPWRPSTRPACSQHTHTTLPSCPSCCSLLTAVAVAHGAGAAVWCMCSCSHRFRPRWLFEKQQARHHLNHGCHPPHCPWYHPVSKVMNAALPVLLELPGAVFVEISTAPTLAPRHQHSDSQPCPPSLQLFLCCLECLTDGLKCLM